MSDVKIPKDSVMGVRVNRLVKAAAKKEAAKNGLSLAKYLENIVLNHLKANGVKVTATVEIL